MPGFADVGVTVTDLMAHVDADEPFNPDLMIDKREMPVSPK